MTGRIPSRCFGPAFRVADAREEDDRRFLEALDFFAVENVRWRALPARFGNWNSVWKRFDRLSKAGVFEAFFDTLARLHECVSATDPDVRFHRRACARVGGRRQRAQEAQALERRVHDENPRQGGRVGRHHRFRSDRRRSADAPHFETLLDIGPDIQPRAGICDKGYASMANRAAARARGIAPVIPQSSNEKDKPKFFAKRLYKARASSRVWGASNASRRRITLRKVSPELPFRR
jgi:transposase